MRHRRPYRGLRAAAVATVFGVLAVGCGQTAEVASTSGDPAPQPSREATGQPSSQAAERSLASIGRVAPSAKPSDEVSVPPGDPGLDAPPAPGPGVTRADAEEHAEDPAPRRVPTRASLTVGDLRMTYGGRWEQRPGGADDCVVPEGALAARTTSYGGTPAGTVVQTVASYGDIRRADAAVLDLRYAAERCGWTDVHDPRIGSAAVAADDDQGRSLTAVSADGVLVVLVGTGTVATGWKWDALVDLAIGTSCPAAVGGCH